MRNYCILLSFMFTFGLIYLSNVRKPCGFSIQTTFLPIYIHI